MSWLTVAALVLTAAGTGASIAGQEEAKSAQENAQKQEAERQALLSKKAHTEFAASLAKSGTDVADKELATGEQKRLVAYDQAAAKPSAVTSTTNKIVAGAGPAKSAATVNKAMQSAWSNAVGGNQAKLGATQDWILDQKIKDERANQNLALIGNKSQGSARVFSGAELPHAAHAGDTYGTIGSILSAAGMLVGGVGATGAGSSGAGYNTGAFATNGSMSTVPAGGYGATATANGAAAQDFQGSAWSSIGR